MKVLATLFALALGHRMNTINPTNDLSPSRNDHETFMSKEVGQGRLTSWSGQENIAIVQVRRLGGAFFHFPYWEIVKGVNKGQSVEGKPVSLTWKSWNNPLAKARNSVREGDRKGKTVNRVHYNQLRRKHGRARAFITTPGKRSETYYTMSLLGWFGSTREKSETGHFKNGRTNMYNMGVGKCNGKFTNSDCKGRLYTAKAFNFGYKIHVFKGEKLVGEAEMFDTQTNLIDKYIIGEKRRYDATLQAGQDNLALSEFMVFIADIERFVLWASR